MAIYNPDQENSLEITFAFERLFLRRDGASRITADILLNNTGRNVISRLRCVLPYSLTDRRVRYARTVAKAEVLLKQLKANQLAHIKESTKQLLDTNDESHWPYHLVRHVTIHNQNEQGLFAINRQGVKDTPIKGFIKRGWHVKYPKEVEDDIWLWFLFAANEIVVFDIEAPTIMREQLQPGESMWLRLTFQVPPVIINRYSFPRRLFARQLEYLQVFMSADAVVDEVKRRLSNFHIPPNINSEIKQLMEASRLSAESPFPHWARDVQVKDWRMFIHREFSHIINEPVHRTEEPWHPAMPPIYQLPFNADDIDCRRGPGPRWLHRTLFRGSRADRCFEFWMGAQHKIPPPEGYIIEITSLAPNPIYNYITWAGLVGLFLSVLNFLRIFLKLI